jgi:hypothetical protein
VHLFFVFNLKEPKFIFAENASDLYINYVFQSRHPVQLLNELRGGVTFEVKGESGAPPNTVFTMGLELDGKVSISTNRNLTQIF